MKLVAGGLAGAVCILFLLQEILALTGFVRDLNNLPYINMSDSWVFAFLVGILLLSAIVTVWTMCKKLKATPGNLIFDNK